jgi:small multidrug resistance pump
MAYVYLVCAIIAEVAGTTALKASEEFTKPIPSIIVIAGYSISFYLLTLCLRTMNIGVTYAVWSGLGVVLVAIVGLVLYGERLDLAAVAGMGLIIAGVVVLNTMSKTVVH